MAEYGKISSEEELAEITELYFRSKGWDLYPEVQLPLTPGRSDYLGHKGGLVMAVECKLSFTYPLLEQLTRWPLRYVELSKEGCASHAPQAVPHLLYAVYAGNPSQSFQHTFSPLKQSICSQYRIGVLNLMVCRGSHRPRGYKEGVFDSSDTCFYKGDRWMMRELLPAKMQPASRQTASKLLAYLDPAMKLVPAGSSGKIGGYHTPFRKSMRKALSCLLRAESKALHIDELIAQINLSYGGHHYTNDKAAAKGLQVVLVEKGLVSIGGRRQLEVNVDAADEYLSGVLEDVTQVKAVNV